MSPLIVIYGAGAHGQDIAADLGLKGSHNFRDDKKPAERFKGALYLCGVNDPRKRLALVSAHPELTWLDSGRWVHSKAIVGPGVVLGAHTHVNAGAFLTRCSLGDFVTVSPNATICGDVTIGNRVAVGAGAVIKNLLTIGDDVTIGCGAVVVHDVPSGMTVAGNPAKTLR